jgi:hypothetical protein
LTSYPRVWTFPPGRDHEMAVASCVVGRKMLLISFSRAQLLFLLGVWPDSCWAVAGVSLTLLNTLLSSLVFRIDLEDVFGSFSLHNRFGSLEIRWPLNPNLWNTLLILYLKCCFYRFGCHWKDPGPVLDRARDRRTQASTRRSRAKEEWLRCLICYCVATSGQVGMADVPSLSFIWRSCMPQHVMILVLSNLRLY